MEDGRAPVVRVTVPTDADAAPGDLLTSGRPPRAARSRRTGALALAACGVLGAGLLVASEVREQDRPAPRDAAPAPSTVPAAVDDGLTAMATLGAARTDSRFTQRLTLTVVVEPYDGRGDSGDRLLGDEIALLAVRARGFAVVPDDRRTPIPLGRFGRRNVGRATTVPLEAVVTDCSVETQARRELSVDVRTGTAQVQVLRVAVQPELVRALDRLVTRTCRRPRG